MTFYKSVNEDIENRGMDSDVREMRMDAVRQAEEAFRDGREQIYAALQTIGEVLLYACNNGIIALSKDGTFRDGPYVLDMIEEKLGNTVPMRRYLEFGLEHISNGDDPADVTELLVNRYFASRYTTTNALTAYIYCISMERLAYGISYAHILEYVGSLVPDSELSVFDEFTADKMEDIKVKRYRYMCEKLGKEFSAWDADDKKSAEMDRHSLRTACNDLLQAMDDNDIYRLMMKMDYTDICYLLLGTDEIMRRHILRLLDEGQRTNVMEELMDIPFAAAETMEKCMETMGWIIKTGIFHLRTGMVLKGLEESGKDV